MIKHALWLALLLLLPSSLSAQTIESYAAKYYATGASQPLQTETFTVAQVSCNLVPSPVGTPTVNPTRLEWDDPAVAGRVCRRVSAGSGSLPSLPFGSYEATLSAINAGGSSPESARSPFSRAVVAPGAPTGLRAVP